MPLKNITIAVVGATGNVGRAMLTCLEKHGFPKENIYPLASQKSRGKKISYGEDAILTVQEVDTFDFSKTRIVLASCGANVISDIAPRITSCGSVLIDNSSYFRMDPNIPLIVSEVDSHDLHYYSQKNIVANPNCSTIQLVMALAPLHKLSPIQRVICSTYQSVSGAGNAAMDELYTQTKSVYFNAPTNSHIFPRPIAFNIIPQIGDFDALGHTQEEIKMRIETKKIMGDSIELSATCVRVPVFIGHSISANVTFQEPITPSMARKALRAFPGLCVVDDTKKQAYITPIEAAGNESVYISRIRQDPTNPCALNMWIVADNLQKGAALNAVQIATHLISDFF